jgi:uncharacterized protein (TIGR00730 family)
MIHITLFCGSRSGNRSIYKEAACEFGNWIAETGNTLVYGGGNVGLMGFAADTAMKRGGKVIGVITHQGLTRLEKTISMADRKTRLIELGDIFVILPGGFGTLDELYETLTLSQLGDHKKPVLLVNLEGYYGALLELTRRSVADDFLELEIAQLLHRVDTIPEMIAWLNHHVQVISKEER